jgi:hypothetical protein
MSFATGANAHPCCRRSANSKGARAARDIAANRRQSFARTRPRSDEEEDDEEESVEEDDEDLDSDDLDGETAAERAARKKKEARRDRTRGTSGGNLSKVVVRGQVLGGSDDGRKRLALEAVERRAAMETRRSSPFTIRIRRARTQRTTAAWDQVPLCRSINRLSIRR